MKRFRSLCAITLAALMSAPAMVNAQGITNIALVHGAFADGSYWSAVIERLQAKGYHVTAVQNPLTSLQEDVDATERVIARQHGDVLLVGHSWGGAVVTESGNADNVKGITLLDGKLCGKRTAFDAIYPITSEQDAAEFVVAAYARNNQDVLAEAECLWLRRSQSDSAYQYLMSLLTTPSLRDWVHSLHEYHKQHIQWIQENPDNGEDVCEGNEPAGD